MLDFNTLNDKLNEAEKIISSNYHFTFPDLSHDDITFSDIMISILQTRVITEGICRFIVLHDRLVNDEKSIRTATLKVYVDDLLRPDLRIPRMIISYLTTIQAISNNTVHFQKEGHPKKNDAFICLESFEQFLSWFITSYASSVVSNKDQDPSITLNKTGAVPPKADGCLISREKETEDLRNLAVSNKLVIVQGYTGIGKTELAKDYAQKYWKKYSGIYYVENIEEIGDYLYNFPIGITNEDTKTKEEIIVEKLNAIHTIAFPYLFIIDNYTGMVDDLNALYPTDTDKYHLMVLVGEEYELPDNITSYQLDVFSPSESMQIFRYFCEDKHTDTEVCRLLEHLSFNPRAIKLSAIFLRDNDSFSPDRLIDSMKRNVSIDSMMRNLYIVLTELSLLENDELMRFLAACLSILPYNGVSREKIKSLILGIEKIPYKEADFDMAWGKLLDAGWISVDKVDCISINPLLSDTIFERINPDMSSDYMTAFVSPILQPISYIRELYLPQIMKLKPFVDQLTHRVAVCNGCDLDILNELREFYIAFYDVENIELITNLMEIEFKRYEKLQNKNLVETSIYRLGISKFNLEDFQEAHTYFSRAIELLDRKLITIQKDIAMMCAYEGSSLAAMGQTRLAIQYAQRSISLRENLLLHGASEVERMLWISHYNYAKVLLESSMFTEADVECEKAIDLYTQLYPDIYKERRSTNVSSLLQLQGRIYAGLGKFSEAIERLEEAKSIREHLKGKKYFATAQVYAHLMETYDAMGDCLNALKYAQQYHDVLILQYRTADIERKIADVNHKITIYKGVTE